MAARGEPVGYKGMVRDERARALDAIAEPQTLPATVTK